MLSLFNTVHSATRLGVSIPRAARPALQQTRGFVDRAVFDALCKSELGQIAADHFAFQSRSRCTERAKASLRELSQELVLNGTLEQKSATVANGDSTARNGVACKFDPKADDIVELNCAHGPVVLTLQGLAHPLGAKTAYLTHHAALLVATFQCAGQRIGLLLDGNDLQENEAMTAIARHMEEAGDDRSLSELTPDDLDEIDRQLARSRGQALNVRQAGFRLVDLDELLRASDARYLAMGNVGAFRIGGPPHPNTAHYDGSKFAADALPAEIEAELIALIEEKPERVERF